MATLSRQWADDVFADFLDPLFRGPVEGDAECGVYGLTQEARATKKALGGEKLLRASCLNSQDDRTKMATLPGLQLK